MLSQEGKHVFSHVGIFHNEAQEHAEFGFSLHLASTSKAVEMYLQAISSDKISKNVLSGQSEEMWFKRKAKGHVYGLSKRILLYVCPLPVLPNGIKEVLKARIETIMPGEVTVDMDGNVKAQMDKAFDKKVSFSEHHN